MKVELITWTPDPEILAATAARVCYSDQSATDISAALAASDIDRILDHVLASGHHSVIEHITFTFAIDDVSRVLTHQLVRHRVGIAFSQQSQRYVRLDPPAFLVPPAIAASPDLCQQYQDLMAESHRVYATLIAGGIPKEDARFALPEAVMTRIIMTANFRQLIHMYAINACFRSQWEFRELMRRIKSEVRRVCPRLSRELKIKCFSTGFCDEVKMCAQLEGRMPRKEDVFAGYQAYTHQFYEGLARSVDEA